MINKLKKFAWFLIENAGAIFAFAMFSLCAFETPRTLPLIEKTFIWGLVVIACGLSYKIDKVQESIERIEKKHDDNNRQQPLRGGMDRGEL